MERFPAAHGPPRINPTERRQQKYPPPVSCGGMDLSPQERQRRSDLARRLHREGKLGGPGPAAKSVVARRAKSERVSELAQEMAVKHRADIERALTDALRNGTRSQKIKAAEVLTKLAMSGERMDAAENRDNRQHQSRAELIETLAAKLSGPSPASNALRARLAEQAIDGTATEIRE